MKQKSEEESGGKTFALVALGVGEVNILGCGLNNFLFGENENESEFVPRNIIYYHPRMLSINK